ncbi:MAG TPA: tRNA lysidine(34) synthetase TilS, partial [Lactobacillus acetotolerans]|nr:tRNA lysidine(34) synthetase TilS [Lactobacillus acetotolerans]
FYLSADKTFYAGPLKKGAKLSLKNGQHAKNKKEFAQAGIPINLRPYCLTIYANNAPVFVEKTYQNQVYTNIDKHYYIYALKK